MKPALIVAHRGASGRAPENTLAAFRHAWELGANAVELDVRLTADGFPIVLHDATLDRTTNGTGPVAARTLTEIKILDAGGWFGPAWAGQRVPTLSEVLAPTDGTREARTERSAPARAKAPTAHPRCARVPGWVIELKREDAAPEPLVERVLAVIDAAGTAGQVRLISFDEESLAVARRKAPSIPRGMLGSLDTASLLAAAERQECTAIHAAFSLLTADLVAAAGRAGRLLNVWTLNDAEAIARAMELGVDEVTTDVPDVALAVRTAAPPSEP